MIDKLKFDEDICTNQYDYLVRHADLDLNDHMNNTKYTDAIIFDKVCSFCQIDYLHEAKLNDVLTIKTALIDEGLLAIGTNNGQTSFKASFKFFKGEL